MSNCCETRKSREFCGCDAWLDGWAYDVVGDGRNFVLRRIVALTVPWRRGMVSAAILRIVALACRDGRWSGTRARVHCLLPVLTADTFPRGAVHASSRPFVQPDP